MDKKYNIHTVCFWCKEDFSHRYDVHKRQLSKYGHFCCRKCYVKEPSFILRRKEVMILNNPFKNKHHSKETKNLLSLNKLGKVSWNKGLDISHPSIKIGIEKMKATKSKMDFTGSKNPNWKGGKSIEEKEWFVFRLKIIQRDFNSCWKCGEKFKSTELHVHHLNSKKKFPSMKYDEDNCITLCKECHRDFHNNFGTLNFTPLNTSNWLNNGRESFERLITC